MKKKHLYLLVALLVIGVSLSAYSYASSTENVHSFSQGTILVPVTKDNMAGAQFRFQLPDGAIIDAIAIPDGMCARATGLMDRRTGRVIGPVGLDFNDAALPLVKCSQK